MGISTKADIAYDAIRANKSDVPIIAEKTGIKPSNIEKVKNHLFYERHLLDRYIEYGIPPEMRRFDSDIAIVQFWKRLESGAFTSQDIQLLRHEIAEAWYMRRQGPSYTAAHNAAHARYPAPDLEQMLDYERKLTPPLT
ncbi:MAG TPA: hypothetical protein VJB02_03300 [Coxiellaceae bacterium]|nr:hypothetical protein [Coxiellaceae bacterium]